MDSTKKSNGLMQEEKIISWIAEDPYRLEALKVASLLNLYDWCLAAGFVRNLVWDKVHGFDTPTALNDIDLVYFDLADISEEKDRELENAIRKLSSHPWSVKNQARMHRINGDDQYQSTQDAMSYWVEIETAVGAKLVKQSGAIKIVAPFGVNQLFTNTITMNTKRRKPVEFQKRIKAKNWQKIWPNLKVCD